MYTIDHYLDISTKYFLTTPILLPNSKFHSLVNSAFLKSTILSQYYFMFEAFHVLVVRGDEWRVPKLFVEMFKSAAQIQAPPTQIPDIDGFASFLEDGQDSFIFRDCDNDHKRSLTQGCTVASDHMEVDSLLRPLSYDLSALGCDNVNFYNFEDMEIGREDGMELGEEYEHSGNVIDIGDFNKGAFLKQSQAHPVDFI
ncbi:hypothetical protein K439DRAFT_1619943 [Ramaria rubella]|nr:hypothetical protein K439DRAFT_1619943 [Ramaria rubella]